MTKRVAIVGVGTTGFRATTPDVSYRELTYEAATKAYFEAGIEPKEVAAFVATSEDFLEGYSISDEYSPDQLGAVLRPIYTIPGDFIHSLSCAQMMILSGIGDIMVVQGMSKASNMLTISEMVSFAMDPIYNRPLKESPHVVAGMEMARFLYETGTTREQCAKVVVKNKRNALSNPLAGHGVLIDANYVLKSEAVSFPLTQMDISPNSDGAVVLVLAEEKTAKALSDKPIWIRGIGWCSDTPGLETRNWGEAIYAQMAAEMAYKMAGIRYPRKEIDFAEVNDEFSYKELQHLEAMRICKKGEAGPLTEMGGTEINGEFAVNPSGGCLGVGNLFELNGGQKVLEVVRQLRGEAGRNQLKNVTTGLAQSWRGIPTTTGTVVILSN
ncbi:MAG: acetyl-CoA acetyltransferase [Thermodesulfobacteriota bacterium]|nr:acetyl-CoA acetyltransferase [Thermodesulfobacteriota bacterium]